jgi:hypothetical protein
MVPPLVPCSVRCHETAIRLTCVLTFFAQLSGIPALIRAAV